MKTYINELTGLEWVEIDHGNEQFTSMLKSTYDEQLAKSKEIASNEAKAK